MTPKNVCITVMDFVTQQWCMYVTERAILKVPAARPTLTAFPTAGSRLLMEMGEDMSLDRHDKDEDIPIACGKFDCRHNEDCACTAGSTTYFLPVTAAIINAPATPTNRNKKTVANFFPLCYNIFC